MRTLAKIGTAVLSTAAAAAVAAIPVTAATGQTHHAAQTASTVLLDCQSHAQAQPGTYLLACGDGNNYLTGIHWTSWTAATATATATANTNDCQPNCAAGRFHSYPVTVTLDQAQNRGGQTDSTAYTRITVHYTGDRPAGIPATVSAPLPA
jgi:hypothetical protein